MAELSANKQIFCIRREHSSGARDRAPYPWAIFGLAAPRGAAQIRVAFPERMI